MTLPTNAIISKIEQKIEQLPACFIPMMASSELAKKPVSWWKTNGCPEGRFYYAIEDLGEDLCSFIPNLKQQLTAKYYRITLIYNDGDSKIPVVKLQSTVARPSNAPPNCTINLHPVMLGLHMQREI